MVLPLQLLSFDRVSLEKGREVETVGEVIVILKGWIRKVSALNRGGLTLAGLVVSHLGGQRGWREAGWEGLWKEGDEG